MRPLSYLSILSVSCLLAACIARDQRAGLPATPAQTETRVRSSADSKKAEPAAAVDQSFAGELRKDAALATKNTALRGNIVHAQDAIASSYAIAPPNAPAPPAQNVPSDALDHGYESRLQEAGPPVANAIQPIYLEPAEQWIKKIEALRKQGKTAEADEQMRRFLKRYPNYLKDVQLAEPARDNQAGTPLK